MPNYVKQFNLEGSIIKIKDEEAREADTIDTIGEGIVLYVDGISGSDDNTGLTSLTPFKTLDKALSYYNKGNINVTIYIQNAGYYPMTYRVWNCVSLHIFATCAGVILDLSETNNNYVFYSSHVNFSGYSENAKMTIRLGNTYGDAPTQRLRFEGCTAYFNHIVFDTCYLVTSQGGSFRAVDCLNKGRLGLYYTNASLIDYSAESQTPDESAIYADNGTSLAIQGDLVVYNLDYASTNPDNGFIEAHYSTVRIGVNLTSGEITNKYVNAFNLISSDLIIPVSQLATISAALGTTNKYFYAIINGTLTNS